MIRRFFGFFVKIIISAVLIVFLVFAWMRWGEPAIITVTDAELAFDNLPDPAEGLRIAHFTDTHFGFDYTVGRFEKAVQKMNEFSPHIVVFTGDLFEEYMKYESDGPGIIEALSSINAVYGKYAVLGNHDYGREAQAHSIETLEAGGFTVLLNESIELERFGIAVTGVDEILFGKGGDYDFDRLPEDRFNIVLCHEPDIFKDLAASNVDLMLAGHTHGGQIRVPGIGEIILPAMGKLYPMGEYSLENARGSQLFVSRGLGTSTLPLRLFCPPEVALLTLGSK